MIRAMIHDIEHIEIKFGKIKSQVREEPIKTIKIKIIDEDGNTTEIDCFMTDSGTMNINQE